MALTGLHAQGDLGAVADENLRDQAINQATAAIAGLQADALTKVNAATVDTKVAAAMAPLPATYALTLGPRPYYLDAYNKFFLNAGAWVAAQTGGEQSTTLTAQATAGAATLAVTSGAQFPNGVSIITAPGTATQQIYQVTSGGGTTTLTVTPNVVTTLSSGATISTLWTNASHLTTAGWLAFAYWIANSSAITDPGTTKPVVFLGDSWFANGGAVYAAAIHARFPSAVVVNSGVSGNTSTQMLARFGTDVAANAAYVIINEPGVNDVYQGFDAQTIAANLDTLVAKIRAIGATPIITGMVPLFDYPGAAATRSTQLLAQTRTATVYPTVALGDVLKSLLPSPSNTGFGSLAQTALTTGTNNTSIGNQSQTALTSGGNNTAVGQLCQPALTTGANNTGVGQSCQTMLTSGTFNTAVGQGCQNAVTAGADNVAVGAYAQLSLNSGTDNVAIGNRAQYAPNWIAANATTTGVSQTCIGNLTGQSSPTQVGGITCVGYSATAGGNYAVALGANTLTDQYCHGAVAIGTDNTGAGAHAIAANSFVLGTALHRYKMPGLPTVNPGAASGILWNNAGVVTVA